MASFTGCNSNALEKAFMVGILNMLDILAFMISFTKGGMGEDPKSINWGPPHVPSIPLVLPKYWDYCLPQLLNMRFVSRN